MGIASLILGIVSIVIGFVPFIGIIALVPAIVGLVLGIVETINCSKKKESTGKGIAGIVLSTLAIVFIIFWVFVIANSDSTTTNTSTNNNNANSNEIVNTETSTSANNVQEEKTSFNVGETFSNNNIKITFVSADQDFKNYGKYANVKSGYKVIKATFDIENIGTSDEYVSNYDYKCYADDVACDAFYTLDLDDGLSATISSGKKASGSVYFEVPQNASKITLEYNTNIFTSENIEFVVK